MAYSDSTVSRFWKFVLKGDVDSCWNWRGWTNRQGYANFKVNGVTHKAHRVSYELTNGPIPTGLLVCHQCDNPSCMNPNHLFVGTHQDNATDKMNKGRFVKMIGDKNGARLHPERLARGNNSGARLHIEKMPRGERHGRAKLTTAQVADIRAKYQSGGVSHRSLARQFNMSPTQIARIIHRDHWRES